MSNITPFDFNGKEVRAIEGQDGSVWFVAKDVCAILDLSNVTEALRHLDDDEKNSIRNPEVNRGNPNLAIVSESGLYKWVFRSGKPEAKALTKWVTSEVLPALRKNGIYVAPNANEQAIKAVGSEFRAAFSIAKLVLGDRNAAAISANQWIHRRMGVDCLSELGMTHLLSEKQERTMRVTDLGKYLGMSAVKLNKMLEEQGFQVKGPDGEWHPTEKGKPFARVFDTGKAHKSGTPVQQVKWTEDVLKAIQ
jgi:prophage antirepressor-like protein